MQLTATLIAYNSKRDRAGNCYWAFSFTDHKTGKVVCCNVGLLSGDSNIYAITRHWNVPNGWDRSINYLRMEKGIRDFDRMTKGWAYAGSNPEELAAFIRRELDKS